MEDYLRTYMVITEFDCEDVITTSGISPITPPDSTDPTEPGTPPLDLYEGGFF